MTLLNNCDINQENPFSLKVAYATPLVLILTWTSCPLSLECILHSYPSISFILLVLPEFPIHLHGVLSQTNWEKSSLGGKLLNFWNSS